MNKDAIKIMKEKEKKLTNDELNKMLAKQLFENIINKIKTDFENSKNNPKEVPLITQVR